MSSNLDFGKGNYKIMLNLVLLSNNNEISSMSMIKLNLSMLKNNLN